MPYYSDLGIYTSTPSSLPGIYVPGPYSNHSSIIASNFTRPSPSLLKPLPRNFRGYKPHLATISENQSPLRRFNSPHFIMIPKLPTRPVTINTADIDVSVNKYKKYERPKNVSHQPQSSSPKSPPLDVENKSKSPSPSSSSDSPRGSFEQKEAKPNKIISRDRPTIRLKTIHTDMVPAEAIISRSWRDNFQPEELNTEEKRFKKTPGELLKEKFLIKSRENLASEIKQVSISDSIKKTPSFHDICAAITTDQVEELNPGQPIEIRRRQSRQISAEEIIKELRRNSVELDNDIDFANEVVDEKYDSRGSVKRKKKLTKKKSNEKVTLSTDDITNNKSNIQRRPTQKKIRRTSSGSSVTSEIVVDEATEKAYQEAIRDISQVEIEQIRHKPKPIITATVDVDEKPLLKPIIDEVEIEESPKPKTKKNKLKFNVVVEVVKDKEPKYEKEIHKIHSPKPKPAIVSNLLQTNQKAHLGHIVQDIKKKPKAAEVKGAGEEQTVKSKSCNDILKSEIASELPNSKITESQKVEEIKKDSELKKLDDLNVNIVEVAKSATKELESEKVKKSLKEEKVEVAAEKENMVDLIKSNSSNEIIRKLPKSKSSELKNVQNVNNESLLNNVDKENVNTAESVTRKFELEEVKEERLVTVDERGDNIVSKVLPTPELPKKNKEESNVIPKSNSMLQKEELISIKKAEVTNDLDNKINILNHSNELRKDVSSENFWDKIGPRGSIYNTSKVLAEVKKTKSAGDVSENRGNLLRKDQSSENFWAQMGPRESIYTASRNPLENVNDNKQDKCEPIDSEDSKNVNDNKQEQIFDQCESIDSEEYNNSGTEMCLESSAQTSIEVHEGIKKIMPSKRSLVRIATIDDPDLLVFVPPEQDSVPEPEPVSKEEPFMPLQSNRLSQFMNPFKKPEQFDKCPVEIFARPKTIRKRHYPRPRGHPPPPPVEESTDEEEEESEEESESSDDEYDVNVVYVNKVGASTSSNDSGFDSSGRNIGSTETRDSPTSNLSHNPAFALDSNEASEEYSQSSTFAGFQKSGRITPPATTIPRFRKYCVEDFNFLKVLGKGSFGKVLLAELKNTEYYYAIKCLKKDVVLEDDDVECTLIERKVLALGTKHPYLCHLLCTFQTESHLFFVMEYLNGGDLMFHIQQSGRFPEPRARFYAAEIVSGLKFLHNKGIVYRDLKLDNILLDFDGHVRIADFGMCKLQIFLDRMAETFCGTPDYMAPEIIKGLHYNQCVDWWSFGVLLYEMLIGQSPFSGCDEDELFWSICNEKPVLPRFLSQEASSVLLLLLEKVANKRLGHRFCPSGDIQDHAFFKPIDWNLLEARQLEPPFKPNLQHPLDTQYFDRTFTVLKAKLTPTDPNILQSMDQTQFQGFSYTNPNATDK